jgi:NADH dehydrogenase
VLPAYPPCLSVKARAKLEGLGVTVKTGTVVTDIRADSVRVRSGDQTEAIPARTVLWAAGVEGSPLGRALARATGAELDGSARIRVEPDLSVRGFPEILVIGDLANFSFQGGQPLPGVAQVAIQQGRYAARLVRARLQGQGLEPFRYRNRGNLAVIGRAAAVADLPGLRFNGYWAWLAWLFIHLINIVEYQNRLLVLVQWAWNYFSFNRAARLITGDNPLPFGG